MWIAIDTLTGDYLPMADVHVMNLSGEEIDNLALMSKTERAKFAREKGKSVIPR